MTMKRPCWRNAVLRGSLLCLMLVNCTACADARAVREAKLSINGGAQTVLANTVPDAAEPSPEHDRLQALIGDWKAETRVWRRPGASVEQGIGTMSNFWMLDGRFVGQEYKSRGQRPKYQGLGALGYDNIRKMYTSVWLDTTGTSIYTATGSCDASGTVFTLEGVCQDSATGKLVTCRSITRLISKKKYTFELFKEGSQGKMFKALETTYTRS